jgi:hypothetical protein
LQVPAGVYPPQPKLDDHSEMVPWRHSGKKPGVPYNQPHPNEDDEHMDNDDYVNHPRNFRKIFKQFIYFGVEAGLTGKSVGKDLITIVHVLDQSLKYKPDAYFHFHQAWYTG